MNAIPRLLAAFALALTVTAAPVAFAASVTVFAAASLRNALDEQAKRFESQTGHRVIMSYAGSNALARHIEAGAPADLFVSADIDWMDYIEKRRLVVHGTRVDLLRNALVLIAPSSSTATLTIAPGFALARVLGSGKLAMADPDSVPAGRYGRSALEALGVWKAVEKNVARADNVRAALMLVSRGEAPLGIVYRSDAMADKGVKILDRFPANTHPPIVYPAAILVASKSTAAKPLLDYLGSVSAGAIWTRHGFVVAQ